jgi:hypothetical protein
MFKHWNLDSASNICAESGVGKAHYYDAESTCLAKNLIFLDE